MAQGGAGKEPQTKGMEKSESWGLKPTATLLTGCHPRDSVSSPSLGHRGAAMQPVLGEPQKNKGSRLCPGSQPNLQDECVFISQKFLFECAKAFFPLQARQTRQVYFG